MPAGALPGHTVTLAGKGPEHPDRLSGSVQVVAVQLPHPRFDRQGIVMFGSFCTSAVHLSLRYFVSAVQNVANDLSGGGGLL